MTLKRVLSLSCVLGLTSCTSQIASQQNKQEQSIALREVRSEIADLRHELNNARVEIQILEEQLHDQEASIATSNRKRENTEEIDKILSRVLQVEKDIKALGGQEKKIAHLEQSLHYQETLIKDVLDLKSSLKAFKVALGSESPTRTYKVKAGDSLERIAKAHKTTVENLKKANHLTHDKIFVSQELTLP